MMKESGNTTVNNGRMYSMDLLRCLAMMLVVVLHFLGKGDFLTPVTSSEPMGGTEVFAWLLESFALVAVNLYMLLSGYFLGEASFKPRRLITLWLQVWAFSVVVGFGGLFLGVVPKSSVDTYYKLRLLLPISMEQYWFMTAYFFLYLLLPIIGFALRRMNEAQLRWTLILLLFFHSLLKSILPVRLSSDNIGYDMMWYVCMFLLGAYLKRYMPAFLKKQRNGLLLYVVGCLLVFAELFVMRTVYLRTGRFELIADVSMEYNHLFLVLAAVGLFAFFAAMPSKEGKETAGRKLLTVVSAHTLGVYLLHENLALRYEWPTWLHRFGAGETPGPVRLFLAVLLAVMIMFTLGILADLLRELLFKGLHRALLALPPYKKLTKAVEGLDTVFAEQKET